MTTASITAPIAHCSNKWPEVEAQTSRSRCKVLSNPYSTQYA